MGIFSSNGYTRERLDVWVTKVKDLYFSIFGTNIDLSDDTQDGQLVGSISEALSNEDQKTEAVSKAFSPSEAEGTSLSTLVMLNGIKRNAATSSIVTLSLTGTNGTIIPAGSLVRNSDTNEQFATDGAVTIAAGVAVVQSTSVNSGAVIASAGSLTIIDSNIAGWDSVTNNNDATVGSSEESDSDLRVRRSNSVSLASEGNVDSVHGALLSVDNVISAAVVENDTGIVDGNGLPAHSIAPVVEGGTDADVAFAIWQKKSGGCSTHKTGAGAITETVEDSQGFSHDINFSRPEDVDVYVDLSITRLDGFPTDGEDQIEAAIVAYFGTDNETKLLIGDDVIYSEVYVPIMTIPGVSVTALTIDVSASPLGTVDIPIDFYQLGKFDETRISIT